MCDASAAGTRKTCCLCVALRLLVRCILMELRGPAVVWMDTAARDVTGHCVSSLRLCLSLCLSLFVSLTVCLSVCLWLSSLMQPRTILTIQAVIKVEN